MVTITIDEKLPNAQNIPFCQVFNKFLNPSKSNRLKKFYYINDNFPLIIFKEFITYF